MLEFNKRAEEDEPKQLIFGGRVNDLGFDAPRTRNAHLTKLTQLYNFAMEDDRQWVDRNAAEKITRSKVDDDDDPEIFTVDQAKQLLSNSEKFGLLPYPLWNFRQNSGLKIGL